MDELILTYIKPEFVILIPVLYFIGMGFKKATFVDDRFIPLLLGAISILLVFIYLLATEGWDLHIIWVSVVQGVLAAAGSVYANQVYKQLSQK